MKLQLIDGWKQGWKFYSVWGYAVLLALPEIYTALSHFGAFDQMDAHTAWVIRTISAAGLVLRFVSQSKPEGVSPIVDPPSEPNP